MPNKLTLSVPEETVRKAKSYARRHGTSVSALFTALIDSLPGEADEMQQASVNWPELREFVGLLHRPKPFDARSERILEKHG